MDEETFVVHVESIHNLNKIDAYSPRAIDEQTFEVDIKKKDHLNKFIRDLSGVGMEINDIRPKGNRIEKLFLGILRE